MIFLLVDWKIEKTFFLKENLDNCFKEVKMIGIDNYDIRDRSSRLGQLKLYYKYYVLALKSLLVSNHGDVIVCWNFTTVIPLSLIVRLFRLNRRIIALNIIAPVHKYLLVEWIKSFLFSYCLGVDDIFISVNSLKLVDDYSKRFNVSSDVFFQLNDPVMDNYKERSFQYKSSYVFCGGEARRDWRLMFSVARFLPNIKFVFVARKEGFDKDLKIPNNVKLHFDISYANYYKLLEESSVIALPLNDDKPAGLINLIRASMLSIPVVTTLTPSTEMYIDNRDSGVLIEMGDETGFKNAVEDLFFNMVTAEKFARNLKLKIKKEFSEQKFSEKIIDQINEFNL